VFGFGCKSLCAELHFGESALHFLLQQGQRLLRACPSGCRTGRPAKPGADPHEARSAYDRRRANGERGETFEESTPRDDKRTHPSQSPALADEYTRHLHLADIIADDGGPDLDCLSSLTPDSSSNVGLCGHPKSGERA
jgi:hypothetical protein